MSMPTQSGKKLLQDLLSIVKSKEQKKNSVDQGYDCTFGHKASPTAQGDKRYGCEAYCDRQEKRNGDADVAFFGYCNHIEIHFLLVEDIEGNGAENICDADRGAGSDSPPHT